MFLANRLLMTSMAVAVVFGLSNWIGQAQTQEPAIVRVNRWLSIRQLRGGVTYHSQNGGGRAAVVGDRLQRVGDGITTNPSSTAILEVDTGIGFVNVAENTQVNIRGLRNASDGGRITFLDVPRGQVRLKIRRFTHQGSALEIRTPAGVSAVRGTLFGINVHPDGKAGLAVLNGKVLTAAQGKKVMVPSGFQNLSIPGEPPSAPVPLTNSTALKYRFLRQIQGGTRKLQLLGQVDPVNTVLVANTPQVIDRNGNFSLWVVYQPEEQVEITVITPLGRRQVHRVKNPS